MRKLKSKICTILSFVYMLTLAPTIAFAETNVTDINDYVGIEESIRSKQFRYAKTEGELTEFKITLPEDKVTIKNEFNIKVGANNLSEDNMYAMQFDLAYSKEKVDFIGATSLDGSKYIVSAKDKNGAVTVVVATKGETIVNDEDIVNLEFTAKVAGKNIAFNIASGEMANEDGHVAHMADESATLTIVEGEVESEPEVDKTALKIAIDYADEVVANGELEGVVTAVVKEFNESLSQAKGIYGNKDTTEVEVDAAFKRLVNSIWMLEFKQGNKETLQALVNSAKALVEKEYTSDSWDNLQKVLGEVEGVLADENAMQEEVDEALNNLKIAINALVKKNIDKIVLENFINKVKDLDKKSYINSTWKNFDKVLKDAEKVLRNEDATQEEVDGAYNNLVKAYLDLRLIPDKSALEGLINKVKNMDLSKYTKESVSNLKKELKRSSKILKDKEATQEEVSATTKTLSLAIDNLEIKEEDNQENNNESNNSENNKQNKGEENGAKLPSTGAIISYSLILLLAGLAVVSGVVILRKRKVKEE